jgi:hypothetical protein
MNWKSIILIFMMSIKTHRFECCALRNTDGR